MTYGLSMPDTDVPASVGPNVGAVAVTGSALLASTPGLRQPVPIYLGLDFPTLGTDTDAIRCFKWLLMVLICGYAFHVAWVSVRF